MFFTLFLYYSMCSQMLNSFCTVLPIYDMYLRGKIYQGTESYGWEQTRHGQISETFFDLILNFSNKFNFSWKFQFQIQIYLFWKGWT